MRGLFNTNRLITMTRKSVPKDVGNDKQSDGGIFHWVFAGSLAGCLRGFPATTLGLVSAASNGFADGSLLGSAK